MLVTSVTRGPNRPLVLGRTALSPGGHGQRCYGHVEGATPTVHANDLDRTEEPSR